MAYSYTNSKGKKYYLHCKKGTSASGKTRELYYFAGELNSEWAVEQIPAGRKVIEMSTGLPVLKKIE
jgi:hypothetical protein